MRNKIAGIRVGLGYTQQDMAEIFQISKQAYWNKENGRTAFNDHEKELFIREAKKVFPEISIESIFFGNEVGKWFL